MAATVGPIHCPQMLRANRPQRGEIRLRSGDTTRATGPSGLATKQGELAMRKSFKLVGGLAIVGLVAAGSAAFTATGVTTQGQAADPQFIGGTISQEVDGATLDSIVYGFAVGGTNRIVTSVALTFSGDTMPTLVPTADVTADTDDTFVCTAISVGLTSLCTAQGSGAEGVSAVAIFVPSDNAS